MQGPNVDIALLLMLVLFFGRQQSQRSESYYRLWFAGWIFVLLSYAVWFLPVSQPTLAHLQQAVRLDLLLVGSLLFLVSFVVTQDNLRGVLIRGMLVGVPVVLMFNAVEFVPIPRILLMAGVIAWEAYGLRAAYTVIPRGRQKTRSAIFALCIVCGLAMLAYLSLTGGRNIFDLALAEVTFCAAVLYGGGMERRSIPVYVGMVGFLLWGGFYVWADLLAHGWPRTLGMLYLFWSVPKLFVGSSMIMKTFEDETLEKTQLAEAFRSLYEDFRTMYEEHPYPMWIREIDTGVFVSVNRATEETYGYTQEELLTMHQEELVSPADPGEKDEIDLLIPASLDGMRQRHRHKDGHLMWINLVERGIMFHGRPARLILARDITEKLKVSRELARRANYDALTGLANRTLLEERIQQCFKRCERDSRKATLLTIDVDHFKRINDTYGHPVGDECLQVVAARLASKIRQVDTVARVGGEEFAAIIGGLHRTEDAGIVANSLLRVFEEPLRLGDVDVYVTVSIGIAVYPDDGEDAETLRLRSDEALYAAKRTGRNRAVFSSEMIRARESESLLPPVFASGAIPDESLLW